jgi:hypothetical protein
MIIVPFSKVVPCERKEIVLGILKIISLNNNRVVSERKSRTGS